MVREPIEDTEAFLVEVCWHYFINEMTQAEIARMLSVTRLRVNQAIQRAKAMGLVKVQIESTFTMRVELQEKLREKLGITRTVIAPAVKNSYEPHQAAGAALAEHLTERLRVANWKSLGVAWGLTIDAAIRRIKKQSRPELEVVSLLGGTARGSSFNSFGVAAGFANALGANYSILTAPIYLSEGIDRNVFLSQYELSEHFQKFETLDAVVLTCSNISDKSFLIEHGLPKELTQEQLINEGAIGDVLGQFLDNEGNSISQDIDNRAIGISLEKVRSIPEKILAAAGPHKVDIICAACKRGLVNTLVTDDVTAELICEKKS